MISVAIGVVRVIGTSEPLVSIAPSITSPVIISWYGSPLDFDTSSDSPSVPPAPSTLNTSSAVVEPRVLRSGLERARGRVPPAAGRGGRHDRELARRIRLRRVVAAGRSPGHDDRDERENGEHAAADLLLRVTGW